MPTSPKFKRPNDHDPSKPALELKHVHLAYSAVGKGLQHEWHYALEDISFCVGVGEQLAVIGPNGAGKSSLLKAITGMLRLESGEILLYGTPSNSHHCIAYVPQRSQIDWTFPVTVWDVVMMGRARHIGLFRRHRAVDRQVVGHSLERVGALELANKQIGELSGGQQQRVFIARALALETHLLLLDEPLNGLDSASQEAIFAILADLRRDKVTVLMATHNLGLASESFDKAILVNKRLVAMGAVRDVWQRLERGYIGGV